MQDEDARFGDLRALLHKGAPTSEDWSALCALLHALKGEERAVALAYVQDHLERDPWRSVRRGKLRSTPVALDAALFNCAEIKSPSEAEALSAMLATGQLSHLIQLGQASYYARVGRTSSWDPRWVQPITPSLIALLRAQPNLETLFISGLRAADDASWDALAAVELPRLHSLRLFNCRTDWVGVAAIFAARWPALRYLELIWTADDQGGISGMDVKSIVKLAASSPLDALTSLNLEGLYVQDEDNPVISYDWGGYGHGPFPGRAYGDDIAAALQFRWPGITVRV
jgi:hypothetical protein